MPGPTCPQCHAPMTQADFAGQNCPMCGSALHATDSTAPPMPSPAVTRLALELTQPRRRSFPAWLFIVLLLAINGVIWFIFVNSKPRLAPSPIAANPPSIAPPVHPSTNTTPVAIDPPSPIAKSDEPPAQGEKSTENAAVKDALAVPMLPDLPPAAPFIEQTEGNDLVIFRPNEDYAVRRMVTGDHVKLRGKVKVLRIGGVKTQSTLDASQLEAQTISFTGDIDGQSTVKVKAPGGRVALRCTVGGQSTLEIFAPDGEVEFITPKTDAAGESAIDGDSKIIITAKDVKLPGNIDGTATTLHITLTKEGSLTFGNLLGQVRLHYRKADAKDPEPMITKGNVKSSAEFKRIK